MPGHPAGKFVAAGDTDQLLAVGASVGSDAMLPADADDVAARLAELVYAGGGTLSPRGGHRS